MSEIKNIIQTAREHINTGRPCVLASLMYKSGSTYRRPGARALITAEGYIIGLIGGGCLEDDLIEEAMAVLDSGEAMMVHYDNSAHADLVWGHGLGCSGQTGILLERLDREHPGPIEILEQSLKQRRTQVLATLFETSQHSPFQLGQRWQLNDRAQFIAIKQTASAISDLPFSYDATQQGYVNEQDGNRWMIETLYPPVRLLIFGAGYDIQPVIRLANELGWDCLLHSYKPAVAAIADSVIRINAPVSTNFNSQYIDTRTAILLMTHHFETDRHWLAQVIDSEAAYIGALGPAKRLADMLTGIDIDHTCLPQLHGPAGLDIGGESPQDIALSIIAEIQSVMHGKNAIPLREKTGPIHDDNS